MRHHWFVEILASSSLLLFAGVSRIGQGQGNDVQGAQQFQATSNAAPVAVISLIDVRRSDLQQTAIKDNGVSYNNSLIGKRFAWAGAKFTATGLVAFGDDAQNFVVLDGRTGAPLWHFNLGQTPRASPMSYAVKRKQYFALAAAEGLVPLRIAIAG